MRIKISYDNFNLTIQNDAGEQVLNLSSKEYTVDGDIAALVAAAIEASSKINGMIIGALEDDAPQDGGSTPNAQTPEPRESFSDLFAAHMRQPS